ncbi:hypothetical protein [Sodalis-like endosymbiont of Proechinophthirus fluctus]|uniref:hypothetical protein n=1 Tax=Sodalis-like endosymbiont of Proechinophthirus fluctus TaxID=1462730 RepID=UPI00164FFF97|nr:hypothetical protein [Sodalis-like endosymbiont of Proechinophthirus fluctus]
MLYHIFWKIVVEDNGILRVYSTPTKACITPYPPVHAINPARTLGATKKSARQRLAIVDLLSAQRHCDTQADQTTVWKMT